MQKEFAFIRGRIRFVLVLLLALTNSANAQPSVEELTEQVWKGLGGQQNWRESRFFMFSYTPLKEDFSIGTQTFLWDSQSGNCRLDTKIPDNSTLTVLFNTRRRNARVYVGGQALTDPAKTLDYQQKSLRAFLQGSFWLFIPKRLENAERSENTGQELADGKKYDVLEMTEVIPAVDVQRSKYFIDSQSGKIDRWIAMDSQGQTLYDFRLSTFKDVGAGLLLPTSFTDIRRNILINYPIATSLMEVEADKFTKP